MPKVRTCEHCRHWRVMIVGYGKVACVCWCTDAIDHYMIQTGAATSCDQWQPSRDSTKR